MQYLTFLSLCVIIYLMVHSQEHHPKHNGNRLATTKRLSRLALRSVTGPAMVAILTTQALVSHQEEQFIDPISATDIYFDKTGISDPCPDIAEHETRQTEQLIERDVGDLVPIVEIVAEAEADGLHFFLAEATETRIELQSANSPQDAIEIANKYFQENYNVRLGMHLPESYFDDNPEILADFSSRIGILVSRLAMFPREAFELAGIKELHIDDLRSQKAAGRFDSNSKTLSVDNTIEFDVTSFNNSTFVDYVVIHELIGHAVINEACNGFGTKRDDAYVSLNPSGFEYGSADQANNIGRVVITDYGAKDFREDTATLLAYALSDHDLGTTHRILESKVLREKLALLLSRISQAHPDLGRYVVNLTIINLTKSAQTT